MENVMLITKYIIIFFVSFLISSLIIKVINKFFEVLKPLHVLMKNNSKAKLINKLSNIGIFLIIFFISVSFELNVYFLGILAGVLFSIQNEIFVD